VCPMHGGSAPQVREAARHRLLALVDPALSVIEGNLKGRTKNPQVAQRAAEDILDRAGVMAPTKEDLEAFDVEPPKPRVDYSCLEVEELEFLKVIARKLDAHGNKQVADGGAGT
jgi:hypothetical protein